VPGYDIETQIERVGYDVETHIERRCGNDYETHIDSF
jgi:hypothetical protein